MTADTLLNFLTWITRPENQDLVLGTIAFLGALSAALAGLVVKIRADLLAVRREITTARRAQEILGEAIEITGSGSESKRIVKQRSAAEGAEMVLEVARMLKRIGRAKTK